MKAGDCVAFNGRIIHGGGGKLPQGKDLRVFNTQWLGDDVRVNFRSYGMDPDHSLLGFWSSRKGKRISYRRAWRK